MPATLIDVGAATGTPALYENFPDARLLMIEPLAENESRLRDLACSLPDGHYIMAAATSTRGEVAINVHPDLDGSSLLREGEGSDVDGVLRTVASRTVDEICQTLDCRPPYLVKVDVQGAELEVLRGAEAVLAEAELVILEVVLYDFFDRGARVTEVIDFMAERGFAVYDLMDPGYRPLDGALSQIDVAFARENGVLRRRHVFASPEQRSRHTEAVLRQRAEQGMQVGGRARRNLRQAAADAWRSHLAHPGRNRTP